MTGEATSLHLNFCAAEERKNLSHSSKSPPTALPCTKKISVERAQTAPTSLNVPPLHEGPRSAPEPEEQPVTVFKSPGGGGVPPYFFFVELYIYFPNTVFLDEDLLLHSLVRALAADPNRPAVRSYGGR